MLIKFILCKVCSDYVSNDEIDGISVEQETATFAGVARITQSYGPMSFAESIEENHFKCECCRARCFGESYVYATGVKAGE